MLNPEEARDFFKAVSGKEIKFWNKAEVLIPIDLVRETGFLVDCSNPVTTFLSGVEIWSIAHGLTTRLNQRIGTYQFVHQKDEDEWQKNLAAEERTSER